MLLMENIELDVSVPVGPVLHILEELVSQLALPDEPNGLLMAVMLSENLICVHFWSLKLTRLMGVGKKIR